MLVTAGMPEADRVAALELGANDCMPAEMSPREMLAHVKVQLRRPWTNSAGLTCGALEVDRARGMVRIGGRTVALTAVEVRLLTVLIRRAGAVLKNSRGRQAHCPMPHTFWDHRGRLGHTGRV